MPRVRNSGKRFMKKRRTQNKEKMREKNWEMFVIWAIFTILTIIFGLLTIYEDGYYGWGIIIYNLILLVAIILNGAKQSNDTK